jgi:hypothetical protein
LPGRLADAKSYAERLFDCRPLGLLDDPTAADALAIPAIEVGASWDQDALDNVVSVASGCPYR